MTPKTSPLPWRIRRAETDFDSDPAWYIGEDVEGYRTHAAEVYTEEDADFIVLAVNSHAKLVEALEAVMKQYLAYHEGNCKAIDLGYEALALAKGAP